MTEKARKGSGEGPARRRPSKATAPGPERRTSRAVRLNESGFRVVTVPVYLHGCRHNEDICPIGGHHHRGTCVRETWLFRVDEPAPFTKLYVPWLPAPPEGVPAESIVLAPGQATASDGRVLA